MTSTKQAVLTRHWIVLDSGGPKPLCTVKHKTQEAVTACSGYHEIPRGAFWDGDCPDDRLGDLRSDLRYARKLYKSILARWERQLIQLESIPVAQAFAEYRRKLIDKHVAEKPVFKFTWSADS